MADYTCHQIALMVRPVGDSITSERATTIRVDDEGAGPYVVVDQHGRSDVGRICIDVDEWPALRDAITQQIELCAELCREELEKDGEHV